MSAGDQKFLKRKTEKELYSYENKKSSSQINSNSNENTKDINSKTKLTYFSSSSSYKRGILNGHMLKVSNFKPFNSKFLMENNIVNNECKKLNSEKVSLGYTYGNTNVKGIKNLRSLIINDIKILSELMKNRSKSSNKSKINNCPFNQKQQEKNKSFIFSIHSEEIMDSDINSDSSDSEKDETDIILRNMDQKSSIRDKDKIVSFNKSISSLDSGIFEGENSVSFGSPIRSNNEGFSTDFPENSGNISDEEDNPLKILSKYKL